MIPSYVYKLSTFACQLSIVNRKHFINLSLPIIFILSGCVHKTGSDPEKESGVKSLVQKQEKKVLPLDTLMHHKRLNALANGDTTGLCPVKDQPYPLEGSILPFKGMEPFSVWLV